MLSKSNSSIKTKDSLKIKGKFYVEIERAGKIISQFDFENQVVDVGANKLLGVGFHGDAQIPTWYIGLVDNGSFSAFANADTMSSHAGWLEFVGYSGGARPAWGPVASASRSIANSVLVTYTMSAGGTLKGAFVTSDNTLSGTTGTLWAEAAFPSNQPVLTGDLVRITYTINIA